jgi:outer membrane receptor protein involved in Fe transport
VIEQFIDASVAHLASERGEYTASDYRAALRSMAGVMLSHRELSPSWPVLLSWLAGEGAPTMLRHLVHNHEVIRLSGAPPGSGVSSRPRNLSSQLNENQFEHNFYNVVAVQKKIDDLDAQLSYFMRYSGVHFVPDPLGDLFFNNVASDVDRSSFLNGIQGDGGYRINDSHTVRAGFLISSEQTQDNNTSLVLSTGLGGACGAAPECTVVDDIPKLGWLLGTYVQDEWRIADKLTLNTGLRFDQMWEFVDANQFSPRASLVYGPFDGMTLHAGYARYFTPAHDLARQ